MIICIILYIGHMNLYFKYFDIYNEIKDVVSM